MTLTKDGVNDMFDVLDAIVDALYQRPAVEGNRDE